MMELFAKTCTGFRETDPDAKRVQQREAVTAAGLMAQRRRQWRESREMGAGAVGRTVGFHGRTQPTAESTGVEGESGQETGQPLSSQPLPCCQGGYWLNPIESQKVCD